MGLLKKKHINKNDVIPISSQKKNNKIKFLECNKNIIENENKFINIKKREKFIS